MGEGDGGAEGVPVGGKGVPDAVEGAESVRVGSGESEDEGEDVSEGDTRPLRDREGHKEGEGGEVNVELPPLRLAKSDGDKDPVPDAPAGVSVTMGDTDGEDVEERDAARETVAKEELVGEGEPRVEAVPPPPLSVGASRERVGEREAAALSDTHQVAEGARERLSLPLRAPVPLSNCDALPSPLVEAAADGERNPVAVESGERDTEGEGEGERDPSAESDAAADHVPTPPLEEGEPEGLTAGETLPSFPAALNEGMEEADTRREGEPRGDADAPALPVAPSPVGEGEREKAPVPVGGTGVGVPKPEGEAGCERERGADRVPLGDPDGDREVSGDGEPYFPADGEGAPLPLPAGLLVALPPVGRGDRDATADGVSKGEGEGGPENERTWVVVGGAGVLVAAGERVPRCVSVGDASELEGDAVSKVVGVRVPSALLEKDPQTEGDPSGVADGEARAVAAVDDDGRGEGVTVRGGVGVREAGGEALGLMRMLQVAFGERLAGDDAERDGEGEEEGEGDEVCGDVGVEGRVGGGGLLREGRGVREREGGLVGERVRAPEGVGAAGEGEGELEGAPGVGEGEPPLAVGVAAAEAVEEVVPRPPKKEGVGASVPAPVGVPPPPPLALPAGVRVA